MVSIISGLIAIESTSGGVQERVLATLLNEMDGIESLKDVIIVVSKYSDYI